MTDPLPFDVDKTLAGLKDFQRNAVEYVFRRLYLDPDYTRRFLIADEVGLGKTLVARGVIARTVEHLWSDIDRIDIVYICSNSSIARQNINRLNIANQHEFVLATRITMLPVKLKDLKHNRLNFVSFTPGTSFNLRSSLGRVEERALLYWLLEQVWNLRGAKPLNVLQGYANVDNFRDCVKNFRSRYDIDSSLADSFARAVERRVETEKSQDKVDIRSRFDALCDQFPRARTHLDRIPYAIRQQRSALVGELRALLASTCLTALEPDLVIMDEFQRFKRLLQDNDESGRLARGLFEYSDDTTKARVLLLSATPYKMYTLNQEAQSDDHYADFIDTLRFLQDDAEQTEAFEQLLQDYRRELFRLRDGNSNLLSLKQDLQTALQQVMVRTERLAVSDDRNGMLTQVSSKSIQLAASDLEAYIQLARVARVLDQPDSLEYWKSSPYLLNFMDNYQIKRVFKTQLGSGETEIASLASALADGDRLLLPWSDIEAYNKIAPCNAKLRSLQTDAIDNGMWQLLWLPPALPYYQLGGPFARSEAQKFTKRLVFSAWQVVPKVIATLMSYEVERRIMSAFDSTATNTPEDRRRRRPLLRFSIQEERLTGMPVLGWMYPSFTLAEQCDPLQFAKNNPDGDINAVLAWAEQQLQPLLKRAIKHWATDGPVDEAWYWAAPLLLDLQAHRKKTRAWFEQEHLDTKWSNELYDDEYGEAGTDNSGWSNHVEQAYLLLKGAMKLGAPPEDLLTVLAQLGIAGPGITAMRALSRGTNISYQQMEFRNSAAQIAWGFRALFNMPEATALIRSLDQAEPYWRRIIEYSMTGCIQAVFDEYAHILRESLGLLDGNSLEAAQHIAAAIMESLTLRTVALGVDEIKGGADGTPIEIKPRRMRAHFALRFGDERDTQSDKVIARADQVRASFNSPFWPFVLATTSIGQEGLDFHNYCHAVVHWNLPANPVDLEQREGRVHRYKGHAIRKNLAQKHRSRVLAQNNYADPWQGLFEAGADDRSMADNELVPYWIYPLADGAKIERHIPILPLSRDSERLNTLRQSLVVYRMVFGQPRQEELLDYLMEHFEHDQLESMLGDLQIDLSPPER